MDNSAFELFCIWCNHYTEEQFQYETEILREQLEIKDEETLRGE